MLTELWRKFKDDLNRYYSQDKYAVVSEEKIGDKPFFTNGYFNFRLRNGASLFLTVERLENESGETIFRVKSELLKDVVVGAGSCRSVAIISFYQELVRAYASRFDWSSKLQDKVNVVVDSVYRVSTNSSYPFA